MKQEQLFEEVYREANLDPKVVRISEPERYETFEELQNTEEMYKSDITRTFFNEVSNVVNKYTDYLDRYEVKSLLEEIIHKYYDD